MTINDKDIECLKDKIKDFDMLIMQFEIPMPIIEKVAKLAHDAGVPVMVNPAPQQQSAMILLQTLIIFRLMKVRPVSLQA